MTMKSAYTKSAARKTALASGLERLLHVHTYKNYAYGGGVIATLLLTSALFAPLSAAYAFNYDPLANTYQKLECTMQGNKCGFFPEIGG